MASGPETSESSDSPVLPDRNALVGLPHHYPPRPCASCSLRPGVGDVCVCVCVRRLRSPVASEQAGAWPLSLLHLLESISVLSAPPAVVLCSVQGAGGGSS